MRTMRIQKGIKYVKSFHAAFITIFSSVEVVADLGIGVMTTNYSRIGNFNESLRFNDTQSSPATCRSPDASSCSKSARNGRHKTVTGPCLAPGSPFEADSGRRPILAGNVTLRLLYPTVGKLTGPESSSIVDLGFYSRGDPSVCLRVGVRGR